VGFHLGHDLFLLFDRTRLVPILPAAAATFLAAALSFAALGLAQRQPSLGAIRHKITILSRCAQDPCSLHLFSEAF
jgi:hypothetical protein